MPPFSNAEGRSWHSERGLRHLLSFEDGMTEAAPATKNRVWVPVPNTCLEQVIRAPGDSERAAP